MDYWDKLEKLIEDKEGIVLTKDLKEYNIPRYYLTILTKKNRLERVARGVYITPEAFDDEMYRIQAKNEKIIYSHETALYLHDLSDRPPISYTVTVPQGYNATHLKKEGLVVHTVKNETYQLGIEKGKTIFGRNIQVYDIERTICDIVRNRKNMDVSLFNDALKRYARINNKDTYLLMEYAEKLNIKKRLRQYMEILLWKILNS